jgi:uncharacterized glyoxalase superfamily protein PhnB
MGTEFSQIDLVASDVGATVAFYRKLGVDVPEEAVWEHGGRPHHVEVQMPSGAVVAFDSPELTRAYDSEWPEGATGSILIFSVPDRETVDKRYAELVEGGAVGHMPPTDAFWGARYAIADDPDGNHVGIMSPSDEAHASAPGFE